MTNDTRSPEQIEREIERDRQALSQNLDGIQQKFSFDTIAGQIGEQFREHGGDISRAMSNSIKENPMAVALTGVGLAWMIFGSGRRGNGSNPHAHDSGRWNSESRRDSAVRYGATTRSSAEPEWAHTDDDYAYGDAADRPPIDLISKRASGNGESADYAGASSSSNAQSESTTLAERAEEARRTSGKGHRELVRSCARARRQRT